MAHVTDPRISRATDPAEERVAAAESLYSAHYARELFAETGLDAVVATSPAQVAHLTGACTWREVKLRSWMLDPAGDASHAAGFGVLTRELRSGLVVASIVAGEARRGSADEIASVGSQTGDALHALIELVDRLGIADGRIGVEFDNAPSALRGQAAEHLRRAEILDCSAMLRLMRTRKSQAALARLADVATLTEEALSDVVPTVSLGADLSVLQAQFRLALARRDADLDHCTYGLPVPSVGVVTSRLARPGETIFLDVGAQRELFFSDAGLTLAAADAPAVARARYSRAREALVAGADALRVGVRASAAHRAMTRVLGRSDLSAHGHGLGLDIREWPLIGSSRCGLIGDETITLDGDLELREDMVINLEVFGFFTDGASLQTEQTFVLTPAGVEPLTNQDRDEPWLITDATGDKND